MANIFFVVDMMAHPRGFEPLASWTAIMCKQLLTTNNN